MSLPAGKKDPNVQDPGTEGQEVSVVVVRTSDAKRIKFNLSLSTKLSSLRESLAENDHFGIPVDQQRIFYMGRELKSGSRSLSSLGLGKFPRIVLHVHKRPHAVAAKKQEGVAEPARKRRRMESDMPDGYLITKNRSSSSSGRQQRSNGNSNNNSSEVIDLLDSDSEEEEQEATNKAASAVDDVVELLDSDSEDDNDDEGCDRKMPASNGGFGGGGFFIQKKTPSR